jgi:DNA-binding transcriptional ArsR family regulator
MYPHMLQSLFSDAGFVSIPLEPGGKKPLPGMSWKHSEPDTLWRAAPPDANLGVLAGPGGLLLIDADDFQTVGAVSRKMAGLGLDPPRVMRRVDGCHWWLRVPDYPQDRQGNGKLSPGLRGDWRAKNGYVVAPPSVVGGKVYRMVGDPLLTPLVQFRDLADILHVSERKIITPRDPEMIPPDDLHFPLLPRRELSPACRHWLRLAGDESLKGKTITHGRRKWQSRSELLVSVTIDMILHGRSRAEILDYLAQFSDRYGLNWPRHVYRCAIAELLKSDTRSFLLNLFENPPVGRQSDIAVYRGLLSFGIRFNSLEFYASIRGLREASGVGLNTVRRSLERLDNVAGLITRLDYRERGNQANRWRIEKLQKMESNKFRLGGLIALNNFINGNVLSLNDTQLLICQSLSSTPMRGTEIAGVVNKSPSVVSRYLRELESLGLAARSREGWTRL